MRLVCSFHGASFALLLMLVTLGCSSPRPPLGVTPAPPHTPPLCVAGTKSQELIAVPCSEACSSFRVVRLQCEGMRWRELAPIEPACACAPVSVPASLQRCSAHNIVLTPTYEGANDGARLVLACGDTSLEVDCDGENDGTGASLCTCRRDGQQVRMVGDPWPGEGIAVAYRAAERCLATAAGHAL